MLTLTKPERRADVASQPAALLPEAKSRMRVRRLITASAITSALALAAAIGVLLMGGGGGPQAGHVTSGPLPSPLTASAAMRLSSATASGYAAAKVAFESYPQVDPGGAAAAVPLLIAETDLARGIAHAQAFRADYNAAIAAIKKVSDLPDTDVTPAEGRVYDQGFDTLLAFFRVSSQAWNAAFGVPSGRYYDAAAEAFASEPLGTSNGNAVASLPRTISDLERAVRSHPAEALMYSAAIADLERLHAASQQCIVHSSSVFEGCGTYLAYLDNFFQWDPAKWGYLGPVVIGKGTSGSRG